MTHMIKNPDFLQMYQLQNLQPTSTQPNSSLLVIKYINFLHPSVL